MPDTPIDLSEGIQSVRLKVPTAEVPIPPEGFVQLHSPAPGELALRLPDGSVVAVGGGGGSPETPFMLLGSGGTVDTSADLHGVGVTIDAGVDKTIRLAAPLVDADFLPLGVQLSNAGSTFGINADGALKADLFATGLVDHRVTDVTFPGGSELLVVQGVGAGNRLQLTGPDNAALVLRDDNGVIVQGGPASLSTNASWEVSAAGDLVARLGTGRNLLVLGLPVVDPAVAGALYNDGGTLKISAG